jgi:hypothetical protein
MAMLVTGVGDKRTDSPDGRGQSGVLGGKQARDAAQAMLKMSDEDYKKTMELLGKAGKDADGKDIADADAHAEQSLILKAAAARRERWKDPAKAEQADKDLAEFAENIKGMKREDLIRRTTLMDIDNVSTSSVNPNDLMNPTDTKVDNDGLYQRFTMSCGPTTAQIVKGEIDPIYALKAHQPDQLGDNLDQKNPESDMAREQKEVLEKHGGVAVSRLGEDAKKFTDDQVKALGPAISGDQKGALDLLMAGSKSMKPEDTVNAMAALDAIRKANGGHPDDVELAAIQANAGKTGKGMAVDDALNDIVGDLGNMKWDQKSIKSFAANDKNVDKMLKDGQPVPFRADWGGGRAHFMTMMDVRTDGSGNKNYLVSDPSSGATRWVSDADMKAGNFGGFEGLGKGKVDWLAVDKSQSVN